MVNSQAITITTVLVACLISVVVFLNTGSESDGGADIPAQSKWTVSQSGRDGNPGFTQAWYLDVDAGTMRVETPQGDGLMDVVEFSNSGAIQNFEMLDLSGWTDEAFCSENPDLDNCADVAAATHADYIAIAEEGKTRCTVTDSPDSFSVSKRNNVLTVGPFTVKLGADGMPATIEGEGWSATIDSIEETDVTLSGCDTRRHTAENRVTMDIFEVIGNARRALGEASAETVAARATIDAALINALSSRIEDRPENARKLMSSLTDVAQYATDTYWCGPGTDTATTDINNKPTQAKHIEWGCYRHDHGSKYRSGTIPTLSCDVDSALNWWADYNRDIGYGNTAARTFINLAYGPHGLLGVIEGCIDYRQQYRRHWYWKDCGRWCTYYGWDNVPNGKAEETRYFSGRYQGIQHAYGYRSRVQNWALPDNMSW